MLTYKTYVLARLADFADARAALVTIPERVEALRAKRETLKLRATDSQPVSGGGSRTEDAWVTSLLEEDYLKARLKEAEKVVAQTQYLLADLDREETLVIERTCMRRRKGDVEELCEELGYERSAVYALRDRTLRKLARLMTGEARA